MEGRGEVAVEGVAVPGSGWVILVSRVVIAIGGRWVSACDVEVFDRGHVSTHTGCPFLYLRANVGEEGVGRPSPQDHDLVNWFVGKEKRHCRPRAEGVGADVAWGVSEEKWWPAGAGEAYESVSGLLRDETEARPWTCTGVVECVDCGRVDYVGVGTYALDSASPGPDWAQDGVAGALLCANVVFSVVLLVDEGDGDVFGG
jgi:hypothetical protein